jgi:hypothetical protein
MKSWPWIERADDFWRTAEFVLYQEKHVGREHFVPLWAPGVNLHLSLELYLKAFLLARGLGENDLREQYGHHLVRLYEEAVARDFSLAGYSEPLTRLDVFGNRKAGAIYPVRTAPVLDDGQLFELLAPLVVQIKRLVGFLV